MRVDGPSNAERRRAALTGQSKNIKKICEVLCKSGKFETGEGCCAPICLENIGIARDKCQRRVQVHGTLARDILAALA